MVKLGLIALIFEIFAAAVVVMDIIGGFFCCLNCLACCLGPFAFLAWAIGGVIAIIALVKKEEPPEWQIALGIAGIIILLFAVDIFLKLFFQGLETLINALLNAGGIMIF